MCRGCRGGRHCGTSSPPGLSGPEPVGAVDDLRIPNAAGGQQTLRSTGQPAPVRRRWCFDSTAAAGCYSTSTYDASCRGLCNQTGAVVVQVSHEIGLDEAPDAYDKFDRRVDGA